MDCINPPAFDISAIKRSLAEQVHSIEVDTPVQHMWADELYEVLKRYIQAFEQSLDDEHVVGIMMTNFGQSVLLEVTEVQYEEPVLMVFKGFWDGCEATLLQHINQLNFMLTKIKKKPELPKRPIGFNIHPDE